MQPYADTQHDEEWNTKMKELYESLKYNNYSDEKVIMKKFIEFMN